ncbi:MAG: major facilitator superfamily 1 transporter [Myxococcaceae bacterium]|nr:major facilitator superfamily 1 transporter [Myxococcaceae bacterium]
MNAQLQPKQHGILFAFTSWRVGALALLSFSSGLPLGLVWIAIPAWLKVAGYDIKTVALVTLAQAPWTFKFLWSPLMDRYVPPLLGRRRGWIVLMQLALAVLIGILASQAKSPEVMVIGALAILIAFASASQDIAIDSYAVEVLEPAEHGPAVGARTASYRVAMLVSGRYALPLAVVPLALMPGWVAVSGWPFALGLIAVLATLTIPVTIFAPEPQQPAVPPKSLVAAVWDPFVGFLARPRALELLGFVVLFNLSDNLAGALISPFLVEHGYTLSQIGVGSGTVGLIATIAGTFLGGLATQRIGVARALWVFGILQGISNLGYALLASRPPHYGLMLSAIAVEASITGMCAGAFGVLLIRLTSKRFSATQFALFSSLFALARSFSGPPAGALALALGWRDFFIFTVPLVIPGLLMLQRFAPWGKKELVDLSGEESIALPRGLPWTRGVLAGAGLASCASSVGLGLGASAALTALRHFKDGKGFDFGPTLQIATHPQSFTQAVDLIGAVAFGLVIGVAVPAYLAARGRPATAQSTR